LLTLVEAAALFWPEGPLTTTSLRNAIRNDQLAYVAIAGKFLTTKVAIAEMSVCRRGTGVLNAGAGAPVAAADMQAAGLQDRLYRKRRNARALISMIARSTTRFNQRPDTLMQDRRRQFDEIFLQRTAGPYMRVK
jgi:hypothetical protein